MLLYENAWRNNYEEIQTWYPVWYREILEMDALWRTFGKQLDNIQAGIIQSLDNTFIKNADEWTISDWEKFLYILYDSSRSLDERRKLIKAFIIGHGHIGQKEIIEIMQLFTDGEITVEFNKGIVTINVYRDLRGRFRIQDSIFVLKKRIPAHLSLWYVEKGDEFNTEYSACVASEYIKESFIEETEFETDTVDYSTCVAAEYIKEEYTE